MIHIHTQPLYSMWHTINPQHHRLEHINNTQSQKVCLLPFCKNYNAKHNPVVNKSLFHWFKNLGHPAGIIIWNLQQHSINGGSNAKKNYYQNSLCSENLYDASEGTDNYNMIWI
jgi:hypothetical protein